MDASEGGGTERRRSTRTKALSSLKKKSTRGEESIKRARKSSLPEETSSRDEEWETNDPMEEEEEENSSSDEERRRKRRRRRETRDKDTTGDTECPHCHKKLSSALGYQYHVDQFVCRPTLRPGGPPQSRGRRRKSVSEQQQHYPRIRGKNVEDRTCPLCQRVFTSVTGMQYHRGKLHYCYIPIRFLFANTIFELIIYFQNTGRQEGVRTKVVRHDHYDSLRYHCTRTVLCDALRHCTGPL